MEQFAQRLREARALKGERQADAADHIGISVTALSRLESNGNVARLAVIDLLNICRYYEWPLEDVLYLYFDMPEAEDDIPTSIRLLLHSLPPDKKALVFEVVEAMARGFAVGRGR